MDTRVRISPRRVSPEFFEFLVTDLWRGACFGKAIILGKRYQGNNPSPVSEYYNIHQEMLYKVNIYGISPQSL